MRKNICLVCALILCLTLVFPAFATENQFVPSITYKETPEINSAVLEISDEVLKNEDLSEELRDKIENGGEAHDAVDGCIVVTSILQAEEKLTDIAQEDRDTLLAVYEELANGSMVLLENLIGESNSSDESVGGMHYDGKNYVVMQLVDVSFQLTECVLCGHLHDEILDLDHTVTTVKFDLGVEPDVNVLVLTYNDGEWNPINDVVNNGDGTVTCVFDHFCPVAFCVEIPSAEQPQKEGGWLIWILILLICMALFLVLMERRRKKAKAK